MATPISQCDEGNTVLALAPGVVVGKDRNVTPNRRLRRAGIDVIEIPGGKLCHGGAQGICCPIARDGVNAR